MKFIIQIACCNEEAPLPVALADLPTSVDGFDEVEWPIIDKEKWSGREDLNLRPPAPHA